MLEFLQLSLQPYLPELLCVFEDSYIKIPKPLSFFNTAIQK